MSEYDLHSNIDDRVAFRGIVINSNGTTPGEIIDTSGFESIEFITQSETVLGTFNVLLEQGDDAGLSDAVPLSLDEILGDLPEFMPGDNDKTIRVGSIGKKRYQRLSWVSTAVTGFSTLVSFVILGAPHTAPVSQQ